MLALLIDLHRPRKTKKSMLRCTRAQSSPSSFKLPKQSSSNVPAFGFYPPVQRHQSLDCLAEGSFMNHSQYNTTKADSVLAKPQADNWLSIRVPSSRAIPTNILDGHLQLVFVISAIAKPLVPLAVSSTDNLIASVPLCR